MTAAYALALCFFLPGIAWPAAPGPDGHSGNRTAAPAPFHAARTAAEQALNRILTNQAEYGDILFEEIDAPRASPPAGAPYLKSLTRALATSILGYLRKDCGDAYHSGTSCNTDVDPVVCGTDVPDHYFYRTIQSAPKRVVIETIWPSDRVTSARSGIYYRLKLDGRAWKIDGISCTASGGFDFNWR